jgi:hypothetical protein
MTPRNSLRSVMRMLIVRLRFPAILVLAFLVVGKWDVLRNYWDTLTRATAHDDPAYRAVSNDTEYFCPMDPGMVSDWPRKCGICNMTLVRRKRGEATVLPDGVVARMQLSPYRVQLAGIQTTPVAYRPLARSLEAAGVVEVTERNTNGREAAVRLEIAPRDSWILSAKPLVSISADELPGHSSFEGSLLGDDERRPERSGGSILVRISDPKRELGAGTLVSVHFRVAIADIEPFREMPTDPPALRKGEPRAVFVCPQHRESVSEKRGRCAIDQNELERESLSDNQRLRWWCPMHPELTSDTPGERCASCNGMLLRPRVVTFSPRGQVLTVPESAVVDTGSRQVAFVETMPGMFEGVEVSLGPRCDDQYPVVSGLEPGQRVVTAGAFLLDAETRLNPSLAASYFGAGRAAASAPGTAAPEPITEAPFHDLAPADRVLAIQQKICPVTRKPLGSMGTPMKVVVSGRTIFLCCEGCESKLRAGPARYLGSLDTESKVEPRAAGSPP